MNIQLNCSHRSPSAIGLCVDMSVPTDVEAKQPLINKPESTKPGPDGSTANSQLLLSGSAYILTSSSLILLNKHALASFNWQCPNSLLCAHCILAVILVKAAEALGLVKLEPISLKIVKIWFPGKAIHENINASSRRATMRIPSPSGHLPFPVTTFPSLQLT